MNINKKWLLAFLCMSIILSTVAVRAVSASDDEPQVPNDDYEIEEDDEIEELEEREFEIEDDDGFVAIESSFKNYTMENEFEITLSTHEGLRLALDFSAEVNSTEFELEADVLFVNLVEFVDQNGDGILTDGEEVQTMDLTTKTYSAPAVTQTESTDGISGYRFEAHTLNETFLFQIIAEIYPKEANVNDTIVKPTETKVTIVIEDFPYKENGSLSLLVKATSEAEMEEDDLNGEEEVEVRSENAEGYFSWSKEVFVDGVSREVESSVMSTEDGKLISLNYPNGMEIVHDPKLGISLLSTMISLPWIYIVAGAAIVALVVVASIRVFRPKMPGMASLKAYFS